VHGQALDLSPEHLHPGCGDHTPHVWDHGLREDFVDEAMVPHVPGVSHVLHTQAVIGVLLILSRLNVDPPLGDLALSVDRRADLLLLRLLHHGLAPRLGLDVLLVRRAVVVGLQLGLVLPLLALILVSVLALLALWQISPHLTNNSSDLPELKVGILILNRIPYLPAISHVGHQRLLGGFWRLGRAVSRESLLPDLLGVEAWVSVLLLHEGVGLDIVLLLLCHKIGPHWTAPRSGSETLFKNIE